MEGQYYNAGANFEQHAGHNTARHTNHSLFDELYSDSLDPSDIYVFGGHQQEHRGLAERVALPQVSIS